MKFTKLLLTASLIAGSIAANATVDVLNGSSLRNGLNSSTQDGYFSYDLINDQYEPDEMWALDAASNANAVMMFEYTIFANDNTFGIYDVDSGVSLELFAGSASAADHTLLSYSGNTGLYTATYFDENNMFLGQDSADFGGRDAFAFYLSTPSTTFYSVSDLNGDLDNDGSSDDHMLAYRGNSTEFMDPAGGVNYGLFTEGNFILAWEDLAFSSSDKDYSDTLVMIESFVPVSEPGTLALLGLGLAGLGLARRNKSEA